MNGSCVGIYRHYSYNLDGGASYGSKPLTQETDLHLEGVIREPRPGLFLVWFSSVNGPTTMVWWRRTVW